MYPLPSVSSSRWFEKALSSLGVLTGLTLLSVGSSAYADTLKVSNLNDQGYGSLRQALATSKSGDTIEFDIIGPPPKGGFVLDLKSGSLPLTQSVAINGPANGQLTVKSPAKGLPFQFTKGVTALVSQVSFDGTDSAVDLVLDSPKGRSETPTSPQAKKQLQIAQDQLGVTKTEVAHLNVAAISSADEIKLDLFPGSKPPLTVEQRRLEIRGAQDYTWFGYVQGEPNSNVVLSVRQGQLSGNIEATKGRTYQIRPIGEGLYVSQDLNLASLPECGNDDHKKITNVPGNPRVAGDALKDDSAATIDVMVVYTQAAANSVANIGNEIQAAIDDANQTYANSGITQRLRLVHTEQVSYTEATNNSLADLQALRNTSDGNMDDLHAKRDFYGADLVSLLIGSSDACGIAYLPSTMSRANSADGFSVVITPGCAVPNHSFAHELGHNMGADHDRYVSSTAPQPYSYGYANVAAGWRTVMAYNNACTAAGTSCTRLARWSNPDLTYNGAPTGVAAGQSTAADNRLTLNTSALEIANYRQSVDAYEVNLLAPASNSSVSGSTTLRAKTSRNASTNSVEFSYPQTTTGSRTPALATTDPPTEGQESTVTDTMPISASGTINSASLSLNIDHTYGADLAIVLIAPDGTRSILRNHVQFSPNLTATYDLSTALAGKARSGNWVLEISDNYPQDTGTLNSWSLSLSAKTVIGTDTTPDANGEYTTVWNTTGLPTGAYNVTALASGTDSGFPITDSATNTNIQVTAPPTDSVKPTVAVSTPFNDQKMLISAFKSGILTGTATDNIGVTSVLVKITRLRNSVVQVWNGSAWGTASATIPATLSGSGTSITWKLDALFPPQAQLDEGQYIIVVYAYDATGNTSNVTSRVSLYASDTQLPVAQVFTPTLNQKVLLSAFTSGAANTISGNATDNIGVNGLKLRFSRKRNGVNQYWNGTAFTTSGVFLNATLATVGGTSPKWNLDSQMPPLSALDSGLYQIEAYAVDIAGNKSTTIVRPFTLGTDFTAPSVVITAPTQSQKIALNNFVAGTVNGTAADNIGITSVKVKLQRKRGTTTTYWNGSTFTTTVATVDAVVTTVGGTSVTWSLNNVPTPATGLDAGAYTLYASSYDAVGNTKSSASRSFTLSTPVAGDPTPSAAPSGGSSSRHL